MKPAVELLVRMARGSGLPVISEFGLYALARILFADRGYMGTPIPARSRVNTATWRNFGGADFSLSSGLTNP
ncbi:MAG: hypothetical protein Q8Q79_02925 [Sphingopyxis sp.]|nr:hypothetical protein [Sphingopyxis sp.]